MVGNIADQTEDRLGERSNPESKNFRQAGIVEVEVEHMCYREG